MGDSQPFLEYHFYKGGLRSECIAAAGSRPPWAPPWDWVGFHDEVTLRGEDTVLEIAKFANGGAAVSWVGVFRHAPDEVYGDRHNHIGIGVWLPAKFPTEPALLIEGLESLLRVFQASERNSFVGKAKAFLHDYINGYLGDYLMPPEPLGGLKSTDQQVLVTANYTIVRNADDYQHVLNDLVFRLFFAEPRERAASRALVLVTDREVAKALSRKGFEQHQLTRLSGDFLARIPKAFERQTAQISDLRAALEAERARTDQLDTRIDRLESDLSAAIDRASEFERQCDELRNSLEGNDEHQRHAILLQKLSDSNAQLFTLSRELAHLRGEISMDIRNEIKNFLALRSQRQSDPMAYAGNKNAVRTSHLTIRSQGFDPDWLKICLFGLLIVLFLATLILGLRHFDVI